MHRIGVLFCTTVALTAPLSAAPPPRSFSIQATAVDPWIARTSKVSFEPQRAADASVLVDLPKKEWMVLPTSGSVVLLLASRKGDAVVLVERSPLVVPLEASDITDLFAQIEADAIKERYPKASDFKSKVLDDGHRRLVAVEYSRPGVLRNERVRQYSTPKGKRLYHVTCISAADQFNSYDAVFSHMAGSFTATD